VAAQVVRCHWQLAMVVQVLVVHFLSPPELGLAVQVVQSLCPLEVVTIVLAAQSQLLLVQQVQTPMREVLLQSLLVQELAVVVPLVERLNCSLVMAQLVLVAHLV
jgi:hypothetical protein